MVNGIYLLSPISLYSLWYSFKSIKAHITQPYPASPVHNKEDLLIKKSLRNGRNFPGQPVTVSSSVKYESARKTNESFGAGETLRCKRSERSLSNQKYRMTFKVLPFEIIFCLGKLFFVSFQRNKTHHDAPLRGNNKRRGGAMKPGNCDHAPKRIIFL